MSHPKRPRDPNQLAKSIVDIATGQAPNVPPDDKDPAAVQRGRLGGLKGGKARAEKMTAEERKASAKAAMWRGGEVDSVYGFASEYDALQWIKEKSQGWILEHK